MIEKQIPFKTAMKTIKNLSMYIVYINIVIIHSYINITKLYDTFIEKITKH